MQLVNDPRCATVPDLEPSLEERRRALLVLHHDLGRLAEQLITIARVGVLAVGLRGVERFLGADGFENVRFDFERFFEQDSTTRAPLESATMNRRYLMECFGL